MYRYYRIRSVLYYIIIEYFFKILKNGVPAAWKKSRKVHFSFSVNGAKIRLINKIFSDMVLCVRNSYLSVYNMTLFWTFQKIVVIVVIVVTDHTQYKCSFFPLSTRSISARSDRINTPYSIWDSSQPGSHYLIGQNGKKKKKK